VNRRAFLAALPVAVVAAKVGIDGDPPLPRWKVNGREASPSLSRYLDKHQMHDALVRNLSQKTVMSGWESLYELERLRR
jgi:hypothetical protein